MIEGQKYDAIEKGQSGMKSNVISGDNIMSCFPDSCRQLSVVKLFNSTTSVSPIYWNAGVCIGVFVTMIPIMFPSLDYKVFTNNDFQQLSYEPYKLALTLNVAFAIPMLIDALLDRFENSTSNGAEAVRVRLAIGMMVPALLMVIFCFGEPNRNYQLYHSILISHQIILYSMLFQLFNVHDREIWSDVRVSFMTLLHILAMTSWFMMIRVCPSFVFVFFVVALANNLLLVSIVVFLWVPKYWEILQAANERHKTSSESCRLVKYIFGMEGSIYSFMTADQSISIFYVVTTFLLTIVFSINFGTTVGYMTGTYMLSVFLILHIVYPGRIARQKAKASDAALESKKAFVQYISHEARGPLSVASMGLELHLIDLQRAINEDDSELLQDRQYRAEWLGRRCVNVSEIADSCLVAQNTLNDLLTYDKIENGMLQVEKDTVALFPFIQKELSPFSIQSRYKNITVNYNWAAGQVHSSYDNMCLFADKHKLAQVFRNLLSNALKFTPVDGSIDVNVQVLCLFEELPTSSFPPETPTLDPLLSSAMASYNKQTIVESSFSTTLVMNSSSLHASAYRKTDANSILQKSRSTERICGRFSDRGGASKGGAACGKYRRLTERTANSFNPVDDADGCYVDITEVDFAIIDRNIVDLVCRVEVIDSGPGISEENMSRLFGKYTQFNAAEMQQGGGSGLGLWLSKSIIQLHGGAIGCTSSGLSNNADNSDKGRGSLFFFELPICSVGPESPHETLGAPDNSLKTLTDKMTVSRSSKVSPAPSTRPMQVTSDSVETHFHVRDARKSKLRDHEQLQSDSNALMAVSFDQHEAPSGTEIVVGTDSVTASTGMRGRSSRACTKKAVSLNIMVVDDAPLGRKMMKRALKSIENSKATSIMIKVFEGVDGSDAVSMMAKASPSRQPVISDGDSLHGGRIFYDLIFIDSEMEKVCGPDAIRTIRNEFGYDGQIYAVTGHATTESHLGLMEAGASGVFVKPLLVDQLRSLVEGYVASIAPNNEMSLSAMFREGGSMNSRCGGPMGIFSQGVGPSAIRSSKSGSSNGSARTKFSLRILIVDDTPVQRKILARALRSIEKQKSSYLNVNILEAEDGSAAVKLVEASASSDPPLHFDLIFMDYDMPIIDGASAIRIIRDKCLHYGPIYAVTANENMAIQEKLRSAGATHVYIKPVHLDQLKKILEGMYYMFLCVNVCMNNLLLIERYCYCCFLLCCLLFTNLFLSPDCS